LSYTRLEFAQLDQPLGFCRRDALVEGVTVNIVSPTVDVNRFNPLEYFDKSLRRSSISSLGIAINLPEMSTPELVWEMVGGVPVGFETQKRVQKTALELGLGDGLLIGLGDGLDPKKSRFD